MWYETLVDASIFREWTLNVGRRDAFTATPTCCANSRMRGNRGASRSAAITNYP